MILGEFMKLLAACGFPQQGNPGMLGGGGIGLKAVGVLAQSGAPSSVTGTTSATVLASIPVPANTLGSNGILEIETLWGSTNNADSKVPSITFGGTTFLSTTMTSVSSGQFRTVIRNAGSLTSQVGAAPGNTGTGTNSTAAQTASVNTAAAQTLNIVGQLATSSDTLTLIGYSVKVANP